MEEAESDTGEKPGLHTQIHRTMKLCRPMLVRRVCSRAATVPQQHWGEREWSWEGKVLDVSEIYIIITTT